MEVRISGNHTSMHIKINQDNYMMQRDNKDLLKHVMGGRLKMQPYIKMNML